MDNLLTQFSIEQIILFIITLAAAIKAVATFWDWAIDRLRKIFNKESEEKQDKKDIAKHIIENEQKINKLSNSYKNTEQQIQELNDLIQMLIQSDKDDIKSWITEQHHKFCYSKSRTIDTYSLDCIEKRYSHYKDEGGNSFVKDLMDDLRKLNVYYPYQTDKNIDIDIDHKE